MCPRCDYKTPRKYRIINHFQNLKNPCPDRNRLLLTDEIRDYVIQNRIYKVPDKFSKKESDKTKQESAVPLTLNQTIHNFNVINSMISDMESIDKIQMVTDYHGIRQLDFEDRLESDFQPKLHKMEHDEFIGGYYLNNDGLLKLVDGATKMTDDDMNKFNLMFDRTINRIKILSCGKWDSFLEEMGVKEVVRLLKSYFLDNYELYLIKHLHGHDPKKNRFLLRQHLDIYYTFIATFDLDAHVCTQNDKSVLGYNVKDNNDYYLAEYYGKIYRDLKNECKTSEKNKLKKTVTNIIKENTTHNLNTLNKIMLELIRTDHGFFNQMVEKKKMPLISNMVQGI